MNNNTSKTRCKRGFTLIELLVVVLIIGILAAVAVPQYQKAVEKSRFTEAFVNLKTIGEAHRACSLSKGTWCDMDELDIEIGTGNHVRKDTNNFIYSFIDTGKGDSLAVAEYKKAGVCLCYHKDGEIVLSQDWVVEGGEIAACHNQGPVTRDYAQLLNIRDVTDIGYEEGGCSCC